MWNKAAEQLTNRGDISGSPQITRLLKVEAGTQERLECPDMRKVADLMA